MIIRKIYIALLLMSSALAPFAQTLSPTAPAQGGTSQVGNTVVSYTIGQPLGGTLIGGANIITKGYEQPEQNIVINSLTDTPFYVGGPISAHFTAKGVYGPGNIFILQLSDSTGNFMSPLNIGADAGTSSGVISDSIPFNITSSANYRARIVSTYPPFIGGPFSPLRIHNVGVPIGLRSETACSDSSYTFMFNGITAGSGGNQIEWAYNKDFIGSTIVNSPANLAFTLSANSIDTIWARSRDSIDASHIYFSNLITVTERVDTLPNATLYPSDTTLLQGDTLTVSASGGVSYYWLQSATDSSQTNFVFSGDSMTYTVDVTGSNGCVQRKLGRAYAAVRVGFSPILLLVDPDDTSATTNITLKDTTIYSCHDYLIFGQVVAPNGTGNFTIVQIYSRTFTPDTTTLADSSGGLLHMVHSTGPGITCSLHAGSFDDTLFWQIPDADTSGNIKLLVRLYTNCLGDNVNHSLASADIISGLLVPGSRFFQDSSSAPTLPSLQYCGIRQPTNSGANVSPGAYVRDSFSVCVVEPGVGLYGFTISPTEAVDTIWLHGTTGFITKIGTFDNLNPAIISEQDIRTLQGSVPLVYGHCITATVSLVALDTCGTVTKLFNLNTICNAGAPAPYDTACSAANATCSATVSDNGNIDPVKVTSSFYQNGVQDNSINLCDTSFTLKYKLLNQPSANNAAINTKHLRSFSVYVNPNFINTSNLIVQYNTAGVAPQNLNFTDTSGAININLAGLNIALKNDSTGYLSLNDLKINNGVFSGCIAPDNDTILHEAVLSYLSDCGNGAHPQPAPYTSTSQSFYSNFMSVTSEEVPIFDSASNAMVAPGQNPTLNFSWQLLPANGNPWNFASSVPTDSPFFECPTVIYRAVLTIPEQVALVDTDSITYNNGSGIAQPLAITHDVNGSWYATLPGLGYRDSISYQVKLNLAFCAGDSLPIPPVNVITSLEAICEDGTCSTKYCVKAIANTVSVHCPGLCGGSGIGTSEFVMTNLNAPYVHAGYACDPIDFKVTGQGFHGDIPPSSTDTIFLVLTYPDSLGTSDSIFTFYGANAFATYTHIGVTDTVAIPISAITRTLDSGQWTIRVPIVDDTVCRTIRNDDDTFTIELQMPVECNLGYDTFNTGVCNINGIAALMEFNTAGSGTLYSCDNATSSFVVIAHKYGTFTDLVPNGICGQTLTIFDFATEGLPIIPEMPGYTRPLINWPTDGSFALTYPADMSIQSINYSDTSGNSYTQSISYATIAEGSDKKTEIYGFLDSLSQYYWPQYSKYGPEFFRRLVVQFSQTGCGDEVIYDTLPHQLQDGKTAAQCAISCDTFLQFTAHDTTNRSSASLVLETNTGQTYYPTSSVTTFVLPLVIHSTGIDSNNAIYICPVIKTNPLQVLPSPPVFTLVQTGTNVPPYNNTGSRIYTRVTGDTFQLKVQINSCIGMNIPIEIGYACSGSDSTGLCYIDSSFIVEFGATTPQPTLSFTSAENNFANCKGTCCNDLVERDLIIASTPNFGGGVMYNSQLSLADQGPGYLDISKVVFTYNNHSVQVTFNFADSVYTNLATFNFQNTVFAPLGLPTDSNGHVYLAVGDSVKVSVFLFGDGKNCASAATFGAWFNCNNICGLSHSELYASTDCTFNVNQCDTATCTGAQVCATFDPFTSCSPCSYAISPLQITDRIINPGCGVNSNTGQITIYVSGGITHESGDLPVCTYLWSNSDTTAVDSNLSSGVYSVIVNNEGCIDTATFNLTNSGLVVSSFVTNTTCYNGNNGLIALTVAGGTGNYTYQWIGPNGIMDSTGASVSHLNVGSYAVTITSPGDTMSGCVSTFIDTFVIISSSPQMNISFANTDAACGMGGSATVSSITNGAPLYQFHWSNDSITQTISHINAGVYIVTVTDSHLCSASASDTIITQSALLLSGGNVYYPTCHGNTVDTIGVSVTGGAIPYAYHWGNGVATAILTNVSAGIYPVTVTDHSGCTASEQDTVAGPFALYLQGDTAPCQRELDTITAISSNATLPLSYRWSTGDTSSFIVVTETPGVFSVTVTEADGCFLTDSITLKIFSISITSSNYYQCFVNDGYSATLNLITGAAPYTFQWSTNTTVSPVLDSINPNQYQIVCDSLGLATLSVTDSKGCTVTSGFTVLSQSPIVSSKVITGSGCSSVINIHPSGGINASNPGYTYQWNNNGSTDSVLNVNTTGAYIVTITDFLGCSAVDTVNIGSYPVSCCFMDSVSSKIVTLTAPVVLSDTLPALYTDTSIYIGAGTTVYINSSVTLQNCEIVLGANAEIIITGDDTLKIIGSYLHGCDTMWNGIFQEGGAFITDKFGSKRDTIQDALYALTNSVGGYADHIRNTDFYRNQNNLEFELYDAPDLDISGCDFGMGTYMAMLPAPLGYTNTKRPLCGIQIEYTGDVSIPNPTYSGEPNTFENMNTGISARGCFVNVYKNSFDSILDYENTGFPNGSAITVRGYTAFGGPSAYGGLLVQTSTTAPDSSSPVMFKNCNIAVNASSQSATVNYNRMENVTYGVYASSCQDASTINVHANYINNTAFGVSLINNSSAGQLVDSDIIHVIPFVPLRTELFQGYFNGTQYITVDTVYLTTSAQTYGVYETEITSSNTTIKHNAIYNGLNCISLNNAIGTGVGANQLHLSSSVPVYGPQAGLYASNCKNLVVTGNTCDADSDYYKPAGTYPQSRTRFNKTGISFFNTSGHLCENHLGGSTHATGLGYGMLYSGICTGTQFFTDTINRSWVGVTLQSVGSSQVIDTEGSAIAGVYQNNDFIGPFNSTGNYATYSYISGTHYAQPIFYYSSTQTGNSAYQPAIVNNGTTGPTNTQILFSPITDGAPEDCDPFFIHAIGPQTGPGTFARIVAEDSGAYYMVPEIDSIAANWLAQKMLYESLNGDTSILNNDSLQNAFFSNKSTADIGAILQSELQNRLLTDSATLADSISIGGKPSGYADALINAQAYTNNITTTNIQAANYVAMSNIYLNTVIAGIDTFTNGQLDTITTLAVQCPFIAGDAVYMARSLYAKIDNTIFFNDPVICQPSIITSDRMLMVAKPTDTMATSLPPIEFVHLYPNPAKQIINLNFCAQTTGGVIFEIMDQLGNTVMSAKLGEGQTSAQYSINSLSNAIYYWRLKDAQRTIKTGKVAVMK